MHFHALIVARQVFHIEGSSCEIGTIEANKTSTLSGITRTTTHVRTTTYARWPSLYTAIAKSTSLAIRKMMEGRRLSSANRNMSTKIVLSAASFFPFGTSIKLTAVLWHLSWTFLGK